MKPTNSHKRICLLWLLLAVAATLPVAVHGQTEPLTEATATAKRMTVLPTGNATAGIGHLFPNPFLEYTQPELGSMSFADSGKDPWLAVLLVNDGTIHLSLKQAIALALQNNLDIESVRLLKPMAQADLARAHSGQLLRNLPSAVNAGAGSASGTLATASPFGYMGSSIPDGVLSGLVVQLAGSPIPDTQPTLFATGRVSRSNIPQANETVTGTSFLNTWEEDWQLGLRKGFFTGTDVTVQFDATRTSQNAPFNNINPAIAGDVSLRVDQHLLQGFGRANNMRAIHIARNNGKIADLTFRQQVILTVTQVLGLYYDLVSFQDQEKVIAAAAERSKQRLDDIQKRLDMGLVPESDYIAQQIEVATEQQAVVDAQAQISEQEATLKTVLTHAGLEDPMIAKAHIDPTDRFVPEADKLGELDPEAAGDLAIAQRSEIKQAELGLTNKHLSLLGTRNALRPTFDAYLTLQNNALAGRLNGLAPADILSETNPSFIGGFGSVLGQLADRSYPDYEFGFHLNVPLVNRAAQSDMARAQIDLRQQQVAQQTMRNGIRLQAIKSALALRQARTQYELSVQSRKLEQKNFATEQQMYDFGTSDPEHMAAAQGGLDRALLKEITSLNTLARAKVNLDAVLEETLDKNGIVLDKAAEPVK
jgi:outer membrane protein TolC